MDNIREILGLAGFAVEAAGVAVMIAGFLASTAWFVGGVRRVGRLAAYRTYRSNLARSIILGLEFLVAGDIIRTVTVDRTLEAAAVLAVIVLIRIALNLTLELEVEGRWPWQPPRRTDERG